MGIGEGSFGWGARLSTWAGSASSILNTELRLQRSVWTLWIPVMMGFGAVAYLMAWTEPLLRGLAVLLLLGLGAVWLVFRQGHRFGLFVILVLTVSIVAGATAAKIRALRVATPVVAGSLSARWVDGYVVEVAGPGRGGVRLIIAPVRISGLKSSEIPKRVRVSLGRRPPMPPGSAIRFRARLGPPPAPASPRAYDFARDAYFDGIGAVGFVDGPIRAQRLEPPPPRLVWTLALNAWRWRLAERIVGRIGPDKGGVAAAMVTGHEAWIRPEIVEAMRASGLAHILSISGLHMAIVGGFVFGIARLAIAAIPAIALRLDGKRLAALAGIGAIGAYLLISGSPPPAERAAITATIAFLAILVGRRAVSLHALALAAGIILLLQPESAGEPGFQMSFTATAALVALAERMKRPIQEISTPWLIRGVQHGLSWLFGSAVVSFVAGLATGPFAMFYFNRVAVWGLPANLAAGPISSLVIMPALAIGVVGEGFGVGRFPLAIAGWGISVLNALAEVVAVWPLSTIMVPSPSPLALGLSFLGIMVLVIWRGAGRWVGLPLALAVTLAPRGTPPDLWIDASGQAVAIRRGDKALLLRPERRQFATTLWARRWALSVDPRDGPALAGLRCDAHQCLPGSGYGAISSWWGLQSPSPGQMAQLCRSGEVVLVRALESPRPAECSETQVITGRDLAKSGSVELYRRADGRWGLDWTQPHRGERPWVRPSRLIDNGG